MENEKKLSLSVPVRFSKLDGDPHEGTFQKMKVFICSPGKNRNYSYISKEELDAAKASLAYVPVVGRVYEKFDKDGNTLGYYFGGHDYELDENYEWRPTTIPYGVMTADEPWYETVRENGKDVEYLCGYCYLWVGRWPVLKEAAWDDSWWYAQSMEFHYNDYSVYDEDSNFVAFHGCRFDAICILGYDPDDPKYDTKPCFPSAGFAPVTEFSLNTEQFSQLMNELKTQLVASFENKEISHQKGGKGLTTEMIQEIFAKFNLTTDAVDFEVTEDMTEQELTEKLEAYTATTSEPEAAEAEPTSDAGDQVTMSEQEEGSDSDENNGDTSDNAVFSEEDSDKAALFSMTYKEKEQALDNAISALDMVKKNPDGTVAEEVYCWCMDFDDSFVYYRANRHTADGGESKTFRCTYTINEDNTASLTSECEEVFQKWLTLDETKKIDEEKAQLAELIKFKAEVESASAAAKAEELLDQFSDLANLEEYAAIKDEVEKDSDPNFENYELRLFALRGKQVPQKQETTNKSTIRVGIDVSEKSDDDDGYGGLISRGRSRRLK